MDILLSVEVKIKSKLKFRATEFTKSANIKIDMLKLTNLKEWFVYQYTYRLPRLFFCTNFLNLLFHSLLGSWYGDNIVAQKSSQLTEEFLVVGSCTFGFPAEWMWRSVQLIFLFFLMDWIFLTLIPNFLPIFWSFRMKNVSFRVLG